MFSRKIRLSDSLDELSVLLLGPRQTGKSTLIHDQFPKSPIFDLLSPGLFRDLQKSPDSLKELIDPKETHPIVVDEIQKLPELLDVVHSIVQKNRNLRFVLTGSSARKIKKHGNLLGGRALPLFLHPITSQEFVSVGKNQSLHKLLEIGGLPNVLCAKDPQKILNAYVGIYLVEEIKQEGYARNLGDFSKFLDVAALTSGEQLDFTKVGRDVQLSPRTVASYYQVLQDTLIGYLLEPYKATKTRKAVTTPKFYLFDVGVCQYLVGREKISPGTPEFGRSLEHFIFTELIAYKDYLEKRVEINYWRSTSQLEVDFLVRSKDGTNIAIEVKGSNHIDQGDLRGIKALSDDLKLSKKIIVSNEKLKRRIADEFLVYPYAEFCRDLWAGKLF